MMSQSQTYFRLLFRIQLLNVGMKNAQVLLIYLIVDLLSVLLDQNVVGFLGRYYHEVLIDL